MKSYKVSVTIMVNTHFVCDARDEDGAYEDAIKQAKAEYGKDGVPACVEVDQIEELSREDIYERE